MRENGSDRKLFKPLAFLEKALQVTCGKARWLLLALVILFAVSNFLSAYYPTGRYFSKYQLEDLETPSEIPLDKVEEFAVSDNGTAILLSGVGFSGIELCAIFDIDTQEYNYAMAKGDFRKQPNEFYP